MKQHPLPQEHPWRFADCPACLLLAFWLDCPDAAADAPILLDAEVEACLAESHADPPGR